MKKARPRGGAVVMLLLPVLCLPSFLPVAVAAASVDANSHDTPPYKLGGVKIAWMSLASAVAVSHDATFLLGWLSGTLSGL